MAKDSYAQAQQNATTQAHGGSQDVGFPPFQTETFPVQLLWLTLTFGVLYLLVSKVIVPRLQRIENVRETTLGADLHEANKAKKASEEAALAYETSLKDAKSRAQALAQETRNSLAAASEARRKKLEDELAQRIQVSEQNITAMKEQAMTHVRAIALETAQSIVVQVLGGAPQSMSVERALDAAA